jgi:short-subunit dehydrogenase
VSKKSELHNRKHFGGKAALITGSTAGLGKELALQLGRAGAKVILNGRDGDKLEQLAEQMRSSGFEVAALQGDVARPEDCERIVSEAFRTAGKLDILINNAGLGSAGAFLDTTPETFRTVMEINTLGPIYMTRFALPHLLESRGSLIFISSLAGLTGIPYSSLYSASKMALTAIGQSLEAELKGSGIHVGIAYIGFLDNGPEKRVLGPQGQLQYTGDRTTYRLQPISEAATRILRMIRRRERLTVMSLLGRALYVSNRIAPRMVRLVKSRTLERARKSYEPVPKY